VKKIPLATVERLPLYLRELEELVVAGEKVASSRSLAERVNLTSEQIRKDLAYFGAFGTRGVGYDVKTLRQAIRRILGLEEVAPVAVVGAGHLGTALIRYFQRSESGLAIAAVFDSDPSLMGHSVAGCPVLPPEAIPEVMREKRIPLAVIAVPGTAAGEVLARLAEGGVAAVLNFAPVKLAHSRIFVQNLDLATQLQALSYYGRGAGGVRR